MVDIRHHGPTAGLTIIKMMVTGFVMVLLAGTVLKLKVFGGTP